MASDQSESGKHIDFECMIQVTEVKSSDVRQLEIPVDDN